MKERKIDRKALRKIFLCGFMFWAILVMGGIAFALKGFWLGLAFVVLANILIVIAYLERNKPDLPFQ